MPLDDDHCLQKNRHRQPKWWSMGSRLGKIYLHYAEATTFESSPRFSIPVPEKWLYSTMVITDHLATLSGRCKPPHTVRHPHEGECKTDV